MKTLIYLTRHGETEWNKIGRMQGHKNSNLTSLGQDQARWLGQRLEDVDLDLIISSSSERALDTAKLIRGDRDIEIIKRPDLMEMCFGCWEGMYHDQVKANYPQEFDNLWYQPHHYQPVDGESFDQLIDRVKTCLEDIIDRYQGKTLLIVAHGIVLKALIAYIEDKPRERFWEGVFMRSTNLNLLEVDGDSRHFIFKGDISHHKE